MGTHGSKNFSEKHGADAKPDIAVRDEILKHAKNREIACAVAFRIARDLGVSPDIVGRNTDLLNFRLVKCQLGLFGYAPESKIVKPKDSADPEIEKAVSDAVTDGRLPCRSAWEIASRFNVPKMRVSGVCEAMNIKIKPCQLGAF
jgi:hypothetical protein